MKRCLHFQLAGHCFQVGHVSGQMHLVRATDSHSFPTLLQEIQAKMITNSSWNTEKPIVEPAWNNEDWLGTFDEACQMSADKAEDEQAIHDVERISDEGLADASLANEPIGTDMLSPVRLWFRQTTAQEKHRRSLLNGNRSELSNTATEPYHDPRSQKAEQITEEESGSDIDANVSKPASHGNENHSQRRPLSNGPSNDSRRNRKGRYEYQCRFCNYLAPKPNKLRRHVNDVHERVKEFKCTSCDYAGARSGHLKRHIETVHEGIKPFICSVCAYSSAQLSTLKQHIESVHERRKPFKCSVCGYAASRSTDLKHHTASVHQGIKPFKCSLCDYSAGKAGNLKDHNSAVHERRTPFKCTSCDYSTASAGNLKRHIGALHEG